MNNINGWKLFLELRSGTYKNAANIAKKYNQYMLARDFNGMAEERDEEEIENYYDKINKIKKHTYTIYNYEYQDEYKYVDIKKEENIILDSIILMSQSEEIEFLMYHKKTDDQYENTLRTDRRTNGILKYKELHYKFKFATRKEANQFVKEFKEIYGYFGEMMENQNIKTKDLELNVRDFYDTDLPRQLLEQELDKFNI